MSRTMELLAQVNAPIIGAVLSGVGQDDEMGYGYGYSYEQQSSSKRVGSQKANGLGATPQPVPSPSPSMVEVKDEDEDVAEPQVAAANVGPFRIGDQSQRSG
jgi:hypothetical protein